MKSKSPFRLYPEETSWWSFRDYQAVLDAMAKTGARRVLEFGPGSSTLALIEGGATSVDTCEDDPVWAETYEERLVKRFPEIVRLHRYTWPASSKLSVPGMGKRKFDLCLIDGPRETPRRPDVVRWALSRAIYVLVAVDRMGWDLLGEIAADAGRRLDIEETGPLAGAFALFGPPGAA